MAYRKKESVESDVVTSENTVAKPKVEKRKFEPEELLSCVSITPGELFFIGTKSGRLYSWADIDSVIDVEYRDLDYAATAGNAMMLKPRFVVQDKDFVEQHKRLKEVYDGLYTDGDLREILNLSVSQMKKAIEVLPDGAKDSIKVIATTLIDNGQLDSIKKVKVLDEIFDTDLMFKLTNM